MPIQSIDLAVVTTKKNQVSEERRCGMHPARCLKLPFVCSRVDVDGVDHSADRSDIQSSFSKHRSWPHRAAGALCPGRLVRKMYLDLSLATGTGIVPKQGWPVEWRLRRRCFRHPHQAEIRR